MTVVLLQVFLYVQNHTCFQKLKYEVTRPSTLHYTLRADMEHLEIALYVTVTCHSYSM